DSLITDREHSGVVDTLEGVVFLVVRRLTTEPEDRPAIGLPLSISGDVTGKFVVDQPFFVALGHEALEFTNLTPDDSVDLSGAGGSGGDEGVGIACVDPPADEHSNQKRLPDAMTCLDGDGLVLNDRACNLTLLGPQPNIKHVVGPCNRVVEVRCGLSLTFNFLRHDLRDFREEVSH